MVVGIVGLGLIGGSMAKAYKKNAGISVYGADRDESVLNAAMEWGAVNQKLTKENLKDCDLLLLALYPKAAAEYLKENAPFIDKHTLVCDLCGIKRTICQIGFSLAKQYGFSFVGCHPMAGTQFSGFENARASLFEGASLVVVMEDETNKALLHRLKEAFAPANFGTFTLSDAFTHDRMIAYTSQLAHVVSNAYVKSPTAVSHKGFSAGSYKDLTRVAWLNEEMWTELFLENRDCLITEIEQIVRSLNEYKDALKENDPVRLKKLLKDGKEAKEAADGLCKN